MTSPIQNQLGPFMYAGERVLAKRVINGTHYAVLIASAYNTNGLIGPEHNGIAVLDVTQRSVLLDEHMISPTGFGGPNKAQIAEFERIKVLSDRDFMVFVMTHERFRLNPSATRH